MQNIFIRSYSTLFIVFVALGLSACGGNGLFQSTEREPQVVSSPDKVTLMLAEAADKASNALETLAAVEQNRSPGVSVQPIHNAPNELRRAITLRWAGPVEQVTRLLADRASYSFVTIGSKPPVPLVVNIDAENQPVVEALRDVGLQLGTRADIKVDSARQIVELHYSSVSRVSR